EDRAAAEPVTGAGARWLSGQRRQGTGQRYGGPVRARQQSHTVPGPLVADRQVQGERAAGPGLALRGDPPAQLRGDVAADGQAQAGPAVAAAGGPVPLLERL